MAQGQERIFESNINGFFTPSWMMDKGMWVCYTCSYVGCLDDGYCKGCGEEKFVLREEYKTMKPIPTPTKVQKRSEKYLPPHGNSKPVVNTKTGEEYISVQEASNAHGISKTWLTLILNGRFPNKINLKYK